MAFDTEVAKVLNMDDPKMARNWDKTFLEAFSEIKKICRRFVDESAVDDETKRAWHDKINLVQFESIENLVNDILFEFGRDTIKESEPEPEEPVKAEVVED